MRQTTLHAIAACALAVGTGAARADAVQFSGYAHGSVSIDFNLSGSSTTHGSTAAGGFTTTLNGLSPAFTTYCVDLFEYIAFNQPPYTNYSVVPGSSYLFRNPNANGDLAKLYAAGHTVNDAISEAAFQVAVWEIAYETSGVYALSGPTKGDAWFGGTGADPDAALSLASDWLKHLGDSSGAGWQVTVLKSDGYQDEIFANRVPEPGSLALAATALAAMGFVGRRRRRIDRG